jgi:hypothetical protein
MSKKKLVEGALDVVRKLNPLGFYSKAAEEAAKLPQAKGTGEQMRSMLLKQGAKPEELKWTGFDDWVKDKKSVTRDEITDYLNKNQLKLEEKVDPESKFEQYTFPGGENYRETLLTAPSFREPLVRNKYTDRMAELEAQIAKNQAEILDLYKSGADDNRFAALKDETRDLARELGGLQGRMSVELKDAPTFQSSHWDEPDVLAHLRMKEREAPTQGFVVRNNLSGNKSETFGTQEEAAAYLARMPEGMQKNLSIVEAAGKPRRVLHLEELQSDWAQAGRKSGFGGTGSPEYQALQAEAESLRRLPLGQQLEGGKDVQQRLDEIYAQQERMKVGPPTGPYVESTPGWTNLALKKAMIEAARGNYDAIAWTPGAEQAKRFDLSKNIDELAYWRDGDEIGLSAHGPTGAVLDQHYVSKNKLHTVVGQELAERILKNDGSKISATGFPEENGVRFLSGENLAVGGEGMKGYYDKILPTQISKVLKDIGETPQFGNVSFARGNVGASGDDIMNALPETRAMDEAQRSEWWRSLDPQRREQLFEEYRTRPMEFPSFNITPEMREKINQGLPLFTMMPAAVGLGATASQMQDGQNPAEQPEGFNKGGIVRKALEAIRGLPPVENSRLTQIATTGPSYEKALRHLERAGIEGRAIDYGAGRGHGLRAIGADTFEPYPQGWTPTFTKPEDIPDEAYRRLINLNVLNVLDPEAREAALFNMGRVVEPGGGGVISTRGRDVMSARGEPGPEPMSLIIGEGDSARYQKGFTPRELREYVGDTLGPRFDIEPSDVGAASIMFRRNREDGGPVEEREDFNKGGIVAKAIAAARKALAPEELLMGVHNTGSTRKLDMIERLGGIPAPSVAITKPSQGFSGYGDISLVAPPELVTPSRNVPVFGSDVYSPRFPSIEDDKIFRGFTPGGKRKYAPVTMENVLREMKGNVRGGESFNYGPSSIRAQVTPQFKSLGDIQEAREKIISPDEFKVEKEASNKMLEDLRERFEPYFKKGSYDRSWAVFPELMTDFARTRRPSEFAYHYNDLPVEQLAEARSFLSHLRNMPTEYFEAKPQRAVPLSEFSGAVVPADIPGSVVDRIRKMGIGRIEEYGDEPSRSDALMKFVDEQGFAGGGKIIQKALKSARSAMTNRSGAKEYISDPLERDINLGKFLQGTKTVNDEGDLLKFYHITKGDFSEFIPGGPNPHPSGPAIWLSANPNYLPASHSVGTPGEYVSGTNVMPLWASMKSPLIVEKGFSEQKYGSGFPFAISPEGREQLIADGYDSVINRALPAGQEEYIVLRPEQVKSATGNVGTFDPEVPDITKSDGGLVDMRTDSSVDHALRLIQDRYPTHYLPEVGRQVMADGGFPISEGEQNAQLNDAIAYADRLDRAARMRDVGQALGKIWPVQVAKSVVGGMALPRDVYAGEVDPTSEIGIQRAMDLAGSVMGGGMTVGSAPRGSIGMFLGPSAKTADLQALEVARDMAKQGATRDEIYDATKWFQGADKQWRFEVPDTAASMRPGYIEKSTVGEAIDHPELFKAYPQLSDVEFYASPLKRTKVQGGWSGNPNVKDTFPTLEIGQYAKDPRSTALHELQHAVQTMENFAPGGNTFVLKPGTPAWDIYQERLAAMRTPVPLETYAAVAGFGDDLEAARKSYPSYLKAVKKPSAIANKSAQEYAVESAYKRSAGEVEARNVQTRDKSGYDKKPWETQDVSDEMQIVRERSKEKDGGAVEDALHVVRGMYADGGEPEEYVSPQARRRETIASIQPDAPEFTPEERGRMFRQAVENYQRFPARAKEAELRAYEMTPREQIGRAIVGEGGERAPGGQFRANVARALVGNTGLEGSGMGFGAADLPMVTGIPLMLSDIAGSIGKGNYGQAALEAALPAAFYARKPLMVAGRAAYDAGRRAVDVAGDVLGRVPAPVAAGAAGAAAMTPEEAEAGKADIVKRGLEAARRSVFTPEPRAMTLKEVRRVFDPQAGAGMAPEDVERLVNAYGKVASPASSDPELAGWGQKIAQSYITKGGSSFGGRSYFGHKPSVPLEDLGRAAEPIPYTHQPKPIVEKSWEDVGRERAGSPVISLGGDLSDLARLRGYGPAGDLRALAWPTDIHAGFDYMREPNLHSVWSNNPEHAAQLKKAVLGQKDIQRAVKKDLPVMAVANPMGPASIDSSKNMMDLYLSAVEGGAIPTANLEKATQIIRSGAFGDSPKAKEALRTKLANFPGFEDMGKARAFLLDNPDIVGTTRAAIIKGLERADWVKQGFPEVGQLRAAATNRKFMMAPGNMMGGRMVELDPRLFHQAEANRYFDHFTYGGDTPGKYYADVPLIHRQYGAPDATDMLLAKYNQVRPGATKSAPPKAPMTVHPFSTDQVGRDTWRKLFEEQRMVQEINDRMMESIKRGEKLRPLYGFKRGGDVSHRALMAAKELASSPRETTNP